MYLNGKKYHSRINRIVSLEVTRYKDLSCIYDMEMFRRSQVANYMQQAEKDFWNNLAYIYDRVQFVANNTGTACKLKNMEEIQKKQADTLKEITRGYKGEVVNRIINQIEAAGMDAVLLSRRLLEYKLYGLFFLGLYEQVRNHSRRKKLLDIFGTKDLILEEWFIWKNQFEVKSDEYLNLEITGQIVDYCQGDWTSEAEYLGLQITEKDKPVLNRYQGEVSINTATSIMEKAEINLSLSYGNHYKREQTFSLLLMSDEDIKKLEDIKDFDDLS
jgi:hypothetical protein